MDPHSHHACGGTLLDALDEVKLLREQCIMALGPNGAGVRVLRLVSKRSAVSALKAVQSFCPEVGIGALPDPCESADLMSGVPLKSVDVVVLIRAGRNAPCAEQQLEMCRVHVNNLISGMGDALRGATHLHITVRLVMHNKCRSLVNAGSSAFQDDSSTAKYTIGVSKIHTEMGDLVDQEYPADCPSHLEVVTRMVYELLSSAVPNLEHLSLLGHCCDGALKAFGPVCPELSSLQVEASTVPIKALHRVFNNVPGLTQLTLTKRGSRGNDLQLFTCTAFFLVRHCEYLTILEIAYGGSFQLACAKLVWPVGILQLRSTSRLQGLGFHRYASQLPDLEILDIIGHSHLNMIKLLQSLPSLQSLTVHKGVIVFEAWHLFYGEFKDDYEKLKDQVELMHISCPRLLLRGDSNCVQIVMRWLPLMSTTTWLTVELTSLQESPLDFLIQVPGTFPDLSTLELSDISLNLGPDAPKLLQNIPHVGPIEEDALQPLVGCKRLTDVCLHIDVLLTTLGLFDFCISFEFLEQVRCLACKKKRPLLVQKDLEIMLKTVKPKTCRINYIRAPGCHK